MNTFGRAGFLFAGGFIFFLFLCFSAAAQISAPAAKAKLAVSYFPRNGLVLDSIYLFYPEVPSLTAQLEGNSASLTFRWQKYDPSGSTFGPVFRTETGSSSAVSDLADGGYRVTISAAGMADTSFVAWCYPYNGINLSLVKDGSGNLPFGSYTCQTLFLVSNPSLVRPFLYYDPFTGEAYSDFEANLFNRYFVFSWSGAPALQPSDLTNGKAACRVMNPPYVDTRFTVQVTDPFSGESYSDHLFHASIRPRAVLQAEPVTDGNGKMSAPLLVRFSNQSLNSDRAVLVLDHEDRSVEPFSQADYTYTTPRPNAYDKFPYRPVLTVEKWGLVNGVQVPVCRDSMQVEITVERSLLQVPNVFTPGGANPYFKMYGVSIKHFEIYIFTRSGKQIYSYKGNDLNNWQGWDGTTDKGARAADGAYIYVIKATGWDPDDKRPQQDKRYEDGVFKGFFYLFRAD
ncbi:MAG: gliding motility-associated C-terminal domain-containing protein [Bacteroidales bacterium]